MALLVLAGFLGGALNSVVGGGSFLVFPALLFAGVTPVSANATTSLVLWPAAVASAAAYRRELRQPRRWLVSLGAASLIGGGMGGALLLRTSNTTFVRLVPWLLLLATVLFTFGGSLTSRLRTTATGGERGAALMAATLVQLLIAAYGGYFGGGMGIMMLASWSVMGMTDVHAMSALRSLLAALINGVALAAFVAGGAVAWRQGLPMAAAATTAGYLGAVVARRIDPKWVRRFVIVVAWTMTATFFARTLR